MTSIVDDHSLDYKGNLRRNHVFLIENLVVDNLKHHMYQNNVFTLDDLEEIDKTPPPTRRNRAEIFLVKLARAGTDGIRKFLDATDATDMPWVRAKFVESQKQQRFAEGNALRRKERPSGDCRFDIKRQKVEITSFTSPAFRLWRNKSKLSEHCQFKSERDELQHKLLETKNERLETKIYLENKKDEIDNQIRITSEKTQNIIKANEEKLHRDLQRMHYQMNKYVDENINDIEILEQKVTESDPDANMEHFRREHEEMLIRMEKMDLVFNDVDTSLQSPVFTFGRLGVTCTSNKGVTSIVPDSIIQQDRSTSLSEGNQNQKVCGSDKKISEESILTRMHSSDSVSDPVKRPLLKVNFSSKLPDDEMEPGLVDIAVMPDGTFVVSDGCNLCLKSFFYRGKNLCHSRLPVGQPVWQVTPLTSGRLAVTVPELRQIILVETRPELVLQKILKTEKEYQGLVAVKDNLMAASAVSGFSACVDLVDFKGVTVKRVYTDKSGPYLANRFWYLSATPIGNILISDITKTALISVNEDGEVQYKYQPDWEMSLEDPHGVCCDREGHIYLARSTAHKIYSLSSICEEQGIVVSGDDGLMKPWGVAVSGDGLLCVAESDGQIKGFQLQSV